MKIYCNKLPVTLIIALSGNQCLGLENRSYICRDLGLGFGLAFFDLCLKLRGLANVP